MHVDVSSVCVVLCAATDSSLAGFIEKPWYLFNSPIMTCLDDHELKYKLHGTQMVTQPLEVASPDLLRIAGVATERQSFIQSSRITLLSFYI